MLSLNFFLLVIFDSLATHIPLNWLQDLEDFLAIFFVSIRSQLASLRVDISLGGGTLSDHELIAAPLSTRVDSHGYVPLFELADDVIELRRQYEITVGLGLLAEEEEEHESLKLFAILLTHIPHHI